MLNLKMPGDTLYFWRISLKIKIKDGRQIQKRLGTPGLQSRTTVSPLIVALSLPDLANIKFQRWIVGTQRQQYQKKIVMVADT